MKKKRLLLLLFFACVSGWGVTSFLTSSAKKIEKAKFYIQEGAYEKCIDILASLHKKKMTLPLSLYEGYVALLQGDYSDARHSFAEAKNVKSKVPSLQLELSIANAMCNFCEEKEINVPEVEERQKANPWFKLVKGLSAFQQEQYQETILAWSDIDYNNIETESIASSWLAFCMGQILSLEDFELRLARAFIEEKNFTLARERLERVKQLTHSSSTQSLASLYLGYSYLKEAEERKGQNPPPFTYSLEDRDHYLQIDQQLSYYKLACFYFERSSLAPLSADQKSVIIDALKKRAEAVLLEEPFLAESFFYIILPLQRWQAVTDLKYLAEIAIDQLSIFSDEQAQPIAMQLHLYLKDSLFHHMMAEYLTDVMIKEMSKGNIEKFTRQYALMKALLPNNMYFQQKCANHIVTHLERAILQDDERLQKVNFYLRCLENLEQKIPYLSLKLLEQAKVLWQEKGQELKATNLMQLAFNLSHDKGATREAIESYLSTLFEQAEASNLVERLSYIYDALASFHIKVKSLLNPSVLANHLADAHYHFQVGEFSSSKVLSSWVLKLDPQNQEALRLLGLNYYHLGNYQEAIAILQRLFFLDADSHKALILSEVFSTPEQNHLVQSEEEYSFRRWDSFMPD